MRSAAVTPQGGFGNRFGLVYVDFDTLERIPKLSADQFLEAARQNAVVDPMANARPSTQLRNAAAREACTLGASIHRGEPARLTSC